MRRPSGILRAIQRALFYPAPPTIPAAGRLPQQRLQMPAARPSWDLAGISQWMGGSKSFWHVPLVQPYGLYLTLREAIPLINAAIKMKCYLIGCPEIIAKDPVKQELGDWLNGLFVNRTQTGWEPWCETFTDDMLTFGRSHCEMVLTNARDDIYALTQVHPMTVALQPQGDGYNLNWVQFQAGGGVPTLLPRELMLNAVYDVRTDDPYGTSTMASLPLVAETQAKIITSVGATWQRFGTPRYSVTWEPPTGWDDPSGDRGDTIISKIQTQFEASELAAANGQVQNFYGAGNIKLEVIGAAGETLDITAPVRVIEEEICSNFHLPPFLLGRQWATTERMASVQALLLGASINSARRALLPQYRRLLTLRQMLTGRSKNFELQFSDVSLMDRYEEAHASFFEAQGKQLEFENNKAMFKLGLLTNVEWIKRNREDLDHLTEKELLAQLPDVIRSADDLPEAAAPAAPFGAGPQPAGSQGPPPRPTSARSLIEAEMRRWSSELSYSKNGKEGS